MSLLQEPMHPGEVLSVLYLGPLGMGAIAFARRLGVPRTRVERLVKGVTSVTPDTAMRLARALNTTPAYWMNMQANYDMAAASKKVDVSRIEPLVAPEIAEMEPDVRSRVGIPVVGSDFYGRDAEIKNLSNRVRDGNHILLSGQRRTGKTSIARELGRTLEEEGWVALFANVENASSPEDAISEIACGAHSVQPIVSRIVDGMKRRFQRNVSELSAGEFRVRIRAELDSGNWRQVGLGLLIACSNHRRPVLLVIDELPIFLSRLFRNGGDVRKVDEFLSWMRHAFQTIGKDSPVAFLTGSIGLLPLVERLGLPHRINYFSPFHLEPWNRETSIQCFSRLAARYGICAEDDVPGAVHDSLGLGIPHYVQRMFAEIRYISESRGGAVITRADVEEAYNTWLLGPWGHGDLIHYLTRLEVAFDKATLSVAMAILAETATQGVFTASAHQELERLQFKRFGDSSGRVRLALGVLEHDGYLIRHSDGYRFEFKLLRDWMKSRFEGIHHPYNSQPDG